MVVDGSITEIGVGMVVPEGAEVYDANGAFVTPGLVGILNYMQKEYK